MAKTLREEMKNTLSEIQKNLQGTNSGEDEGRIKSTIWNTRKEKAIRTAGRKKELGNMRIDLRTPETTLNVPTSKS